MFRAKGFTLLEILVVMSIIAIAMSMIVINLNPDDSRRELRAEVSHFKQTLKLVIDESIFKQKEIGLKVNEDKIVFYQKDAYNESWVPLAESDKDVYDDYIFSPHVVVILEMEDVEAFFDQEEDELSRKISDIDPLENYQEIGTEQEELIEPDIYIFSSGEVTAFELEFRLQGQEDYAYIISANDIGAVSCRAVHDEEEPC